MVVVFLLSALWHLWAALKIADASGDPVPPWEGMLFWVALSAGAVILAHRARRRARTRLAHNGLRRRPWGQAATLAFMVFVCIPTFLPGWYSALNCGRVLLALVGLR